MFALLGVGDAADRAAWVDRLHGYLRDFFEGVRRKEEAAADNKKRTARKTADPADLAAQVFEELKADRPALLKRWDPDFTPPAAASDAYLLPAVGAAAAVTNELYDACGVDFPDGTHLATRHPAQDRLLVTLTRTGVRGPVRVPVDAAECDHPPHPAGNTTPPAGRRRSRN